MEELTHFILHPRGTGDDTIYDSDGNDTYIFYKGCGNDIISDYTGNNIIRFTDDTMPEDITLKRNGIYHADMVISESGDVINIQNFMYGSSYRSFTLEFADGSTACFDVENMSLVY